MHLTPPSPRRRAASRAAATLGLGATLALGAGACARWHRGERLPAPIPPIAAPTETQYVMRYAEVARGGGAPAEPGQLYSVHYTGWLRNGNKFDSSRDRGVPITFEQGKRRVIPGWDAGFEGMRVGGRRRLYIPYQLAYGVNGRPPRIPPRSELIFDVELVGVAPPPPPADTAAGRRP